jgi:hypothetical protein
MVIKIRMRFTGNATFMRGNRNYVQILGGKISKEKHIWEMAG